jgi:ribosomal protein S18 acetylase RimI-like enzyme
MRYLLSPATEADQSWLEELRRAVYRELFIATWGQWDEVRHLRHFAESWERGNIQTVTLDGERIGMIQLHDYPDRLEIDEIQIKPSHQRMGIGSHILRDAIAQAHARQKKVTLSTGLGNPGAVRLYERLGFQHVCRSETHFQMESAPSARRSKS